MRICITGGTGFIGSRLALRCLARGHDVRVVAQENTEAEATNRQAVEAEGGSVVLGSVTDRDVVAAGVEDADVVFHLAAAQHEMDVPDEHFWNVNVEGTRTLLDESLRAGVDRFVHGSTVGVYGEPAGVLDEESPCKPDNIYGETKLAGEELVLSYGDRMPVVALRIPEVYGPGDRRLLKLYRSLEKGFFFLIGDGENVHHPVYVDDLTESLLQAAWSGRGDGEVFLLAGKEPVTTRQMVASIAHALGKEPPRLHLPMLPFFVLALVLERVLRPLGIQPPLHRRRLDFFRKSFALSADRARAQIGFDPDVGFDEGARRTAAWYADQGLIETPVESLPNIRRPDPCRSGSGARTSADGGNVGSSPQQNLAVTGPEISDEELTARMEPFDSFWEAPEDIEKGYRTFGAFYEHNYLPHLPEDRSARILVVSCGPGYLVNLLEEKGFVNVQGIDSSAEKIRYARDRGLTCSVARAFTFLRQQEEPFDVIFGEQEINHLTKEEILVFLDLCKRKLRPGGRLIVHSINGADPLTGSESRAGNFDHYNSFTEYSLQQVLEFSGFEEVEIVPLNLYVFYRNPLNYVALAVDWLKRLLFRLNYVLVGKSAKVYTKKIAAVGRVPTGSGT